MNLDTVSILGISFFNGKVDNVFTSLHHHGGLLTVPAGPNLADILEDEAYYEALCASDIVIPDSGFMVLIWNWLMNGSINKISGLKFINCFLRNAEVVKQKNIFLVNPTDEEGECNRLLLEKKGIYLKNEHLFSAPFYGSLVEDSLLLSKLEVLKPHWILINIGGGVQEKLGLYLKTHLSYKPAIICTGAAIAFKTGKQVPIPAWVDQIYMGWLARCISNPNLYIRRYIKSIRLLKIMLQYKSYSPVKRETLMIF
ncbi:WecB/TagA/CpsF family glycosyltransferase [Runella sp.]|jgi:UDP-N-acetyl-D-mannosaminuronic acid transferase (WecB/TagA/CpsF family)|uniref:WecB/TagA/CpsF family glycosyltransferase n=1 Tax=Runella sp. TaxID=1960881 RepID=UPI00260F73FD|nr:WecB/TagA/CpsF family glycosyltransferase [Runella sp.]